MANETPKGYQQLGTLTSAIGLTVPAGATIALIHCETQNVRWRDDGTNPTASAGMVMVKDLAPFRFTGKLEALKFIEVTASAKLNVVYY